MLSDEFPGQGNKSPLALNGTSITLALYVDDVDAAFKRALDAGAKVRRQLENQFYGDRAGCVLDPFGYQWTLMTHIEDVSPEEMNKRLAGFYAQMGKK